MTNFSCPVLHWTAQDSYIFVTPWFSFYLHLQYDLMLCLVQLLSLPWDAVPRLALYSSAGVVVGTIPAKRLCSGFPSEAGYIPSEAVYNPLI